jgi:type IV pilus assembly protein PilY1
MGFVDENKNGKTDLFNALSGYKNETWSPLAETLYEAGVYLQGKRSEITGTNYTSPVQYYCQKTYILIISDGDPTKDSDPRLKDTVKIEDVSGNGQIDLDEVSKYLYNMDLSNGKSTNKQNIKTYTIGFSITKKLLEDTAKNGGGKYFYVHSSQSFDVAFQTFIADVLKESTSYVAPVVPISQMERTSAGNRMYLAMFKPTEKSFWKGNVKKYAIATKNASGEIVDGNNNPVKTVDCDPLIPNPVTVSVGDIVDANGYLVMKSDNSIYTCAKSYWSSIADGEDVEKGGVGEKLFKRTELRKIYTYLGNPNITDSTNAFIPGLTSPITPGMLGLAPADTTGRDKVINFIHGLDIYDWEGPLGVPDGITDVKRSWILGAFIHSRPVVVHYNASLSIVYAGSNGGMLHAFNDNSGEEEWAFIPTSLLTRLKDLSGEALQFFVDGAPRVYIERDSDGNLTKGILIFGLRRGGDRYIALDITTYNQPQLLWEISSSTPGFGQLGQSWSTPNIAKIKYGAGEKWVALISGGYHENQDLPNPAPNGDLKGKAIYVVDILNGNLLFSYSNTDNAAMNYCIPSDISRVDTNNDGYIDRLYVGDVGGQIWRLDIGGTGLTGKVVFDANFGEALKRKIFYPPEVTLENGYDMLFFGTGDREHPKDITKIDRLYTVKDKNSGTPLKESDLYDATEDLLQTGDATQRSTEMNELNGSEGWYIKLNENLGEKCLSNTVIFYKVLYYSTFQPTFGEAGDPCFLGEGIARIYALNYKTGNAVFNLDGLGTLSDLTRSDRSSLIGVSIPSGVIVTFVGGMTVGYGGVGGGVYRPPIPTTKVLFPVNWKTIF